VNCDEPWDRGLTFKPVEGNAIFWMNAQARARSDGERDGNDEGAGSVEGERRAVRRMVPLTSGEEVGVNFWTRQAPWFEEEE